MKKRIRTIDKRKVKTKIGPSKLETAFLNQYNNAKKEFPDFLQYNLEQEYQFNPVRKWRLDFAIIPNFDLFKHGIFEKIAIEIEGGIWHKGGHSTGTGIQRDCRKYNDLQRLGWKVFRFTAKDVDSGYAINYIINYFIYIAGDVYGILDSELFNGIQSQENIISDWGSIYDNQEVLSSIIVLEIPDKINP